jgi:hypothetical protein
MRSTPHPLVRLVLSSDQRSARAAAGNSAGPAHFILMLALGPSKRTFIRGQREPLSVSRWSFPRRQQYRRPRRAAATGAAGLAASAFAVIAARAGATALAGALSLIMVGLLICAHHWVRLAFRSRVGARSEVEVRRVLATLAAEGWRLRHSLPYGRRGDIDSVAIAPTGTAFRSRRTPGRSTGGTSPVSGRWLHGLTVAGDGGAAVGRSRFCASCGPEAWSASRTTF